LLETVQKRVKNAKAEAWRLRPRHVCGAARKLLS
jgi:hypothetical protein